MMDSNSKLRDMLWNRISEQVSHNTAMLTKEHIGLNKLEKSIVKLTGELKSSLPSADWAMVESLLKMMHHKAGNEFYFYYLQGLKDGGTAEEFMGQAWLNRDFSTDIFDDIPDYI